MIRYRLLILNGILLLILAGSQWGRKLEGATLAQPNMLKSLDLSFQDLPTVDASLTPKEMEFLQPDDVLVRRYLTEPGSKSMKAEIAVIAGHRKRTVHTPAFCMAGDGWEMTEKKDFDMHVGGRTIPATRMTMAKNGGRLMTTFFFTDGDYCTRSLLRFQGVQLLKRFRSDIPLGALVRVIVPVGSTQANAEAFSDEFSNAVVPKVMEALRNAKLK